MTEIRVMSFSMIFLMSLLHGCSGYYGYGGYGMDQCGIPCSEAAQSRECMCRTYTFAMSIISPWVFLDPATGDVYGPWVDIINKVCDRAGKLCLFAGVEMIDCWNGELSEVLNGQWYDACIIPVQTPETRALYDFIDYGFTKFGKTLIVAGPNSNITAAMLSGPHNFKLGWMDLPFGTLDAILDAFLDQGYFIKDKNIIPVTGTINEIFDVLFGSLDACGNGGNSIDFVIWPSDVLPPGNYTIVGEVDIEPGTTGMMIRKDEQCFLKWFNEAYEDFICSDEYPDFCMSLTASQDNVTNYCRDWNEICS